MDELNRKQIEKLINTSKVFCVLPFKHLLLQPSGTATTCCMSPDIIKDKDENEIKWSKINFQDLWQNEFYQELRTNMIKGIKSDTCRKCYEQEDTGSKSYRNGQNQRFLNNVNGVAHLLPRSEISTINIVTGNNYGYPTDWDIRFSRLCNLKCRMCSTMESSQIYKEVKEHPQLQEFTGHSSAINDTYDYGEKDPTYILDTLPHVDRLKILGGEPTLDTQVQRVLDEAIKIGRDDIYLDITSNLTNVTDRWLESLGRFKDVQLQFSIDGTEKTNEYIRSPSQWVQVEENIRRYLNFEAATDTNWMLSFHQTVNIYNIFDFWKLHKWIESLRAEDTFARLETEFTYHTYVLHTPEELDARILPLEYRPKILEEFNKYKPYITQDLSTMGVQSVIDLLENNTRPESADKLLALCKRRTDAVDKVRGQHLKNYIPQVATVLNSG
jgi:sulfatase maturation enzyme AslB (radical SAM superfamily)